MFLLGRRIAVVGSALLIALAVGWGVGAAAKAEAKQVVSPCGTADIPAWSPDGKQIAWYGHRWPLPPLHHRSAATSVLRAFCVSDADGKNVRPLRNTVCSEHCSGAWVNQPCQIDWVRPGLLVYQNDAGIYTIALDQKPQLLSNKTGAPGERFSTDAAGDLIAGGSPACPHCSGPVKILSLPTGAVVGVVGGTKLDNTDPSLSPDGKQVVFARNPAVDAGQTPGGIWTAAVDGSHLHRLVQRGANPLWSPAGNRIAYFGPTLSPQAALRLVAPQGGVSTTLLRSGVGTLFGWSPDGRLIAFADSSEKLAVIDVATRKVRKLPVQFHGYTSSSVAWSPDSQQLLVVWKPPAHSKCPTGLWQIPANGAKPRLVHGC